MNHITQLTALELQRQKHTLNLIASENYPSPRILGLLGSVWSNKYGEGYPGKRYYAGNQHTDDLEAFVQLKALEVYQAEANYGVNVQVLSGSPANAMVYLTVLNYGDTILSLNLSNGGHISHLHATSNWNKFFKQANYDVKLTGEQTFEIDLEDFQRKLDESKPKLVIIGFSAYPRAYEFATMCRLAHATGAMVLADIAHINGLVAAGLHASPFGDGLESADFVSMTTHKTFRGPRGAMLFAKNSVPDYIAHHFKQLPKPPKSLIDLIGKTVFPGTSGGPHFHQMAAIGQACLEILGKDQYPDGRDFKKYSQAILDTCHALENGLQAGGLAIISPTQTHLCLVRLPEATDSLEAQRQLENVGIITNRNAIPFDPKTPWRPSGMRFGTAALASRGLTPALATQLGVQIAKIILGQIDPIAAKAEVDALVSRLQWWY